MSFLVKTNPQNGQRPRVIFEGLERDARKFIENNFPRPHNEPGMPPLDGDEPLTDVTLHNEGELVDHFHGPEVGWNSELESDGDHAAPASTKKDQSVSTI